MPEAGNKNCNKIGLLQILSCITSGLGDDCTEIENWQNKLNVEKVFHSSKLEWKLLTAVSCIQVYCSALPDESGTIGFQ